MITRNCLAIASLSLVAGPVAHPELLLYEPFNYTTGTASGSGVRLNGQGTSGELGLTGTWSATNSAGGDNFIANSTTVYQEGNLSGVVGNTTFPPNLFDGTVANLATSGGYFGVITSLGGTGVNHTDHIEAWRPLAASVTAAFTTGTPTWFSFVSADGYSNNVRVPSFAIGSAELIEDRGNYVQSGGQAIGGGGSNNERAVFPTFWDTGITTASGGSDPGGLESATMSWVGGAGASFGEPNIIVGKIEWNADSLGEDIISVVRFLETDVLSAAAFEARIATQPLLSSENWTLGAKPDLDETQFDTISVAGGRFFADELRIGTTFEDVIGSASPSAPGGLRITEILVDDPNGLLTLTWKSQPGEVYGIQWSPDLVTFYPDVNQSIPAHPSGDETTFGPFAHPDPGAGRLFLRIGPPDMIAPTLLSMGGNDNQVVLTYSEPMLPGTATDPANYFLEKIGGGAVTILSAAIGPNPDTVVLTLGSFLETGASYTVTVNNVTDPADLPIAAGSQASFAAWDGPVISEFMASNGNNIHNTAVFLDADGSSSDWIELFNPTGEPVHLDGWFLTDDAGNLMKWRVPDVIIGAGSYLLVFASDKDRADPAAELHTNFNLSANGEYLALVKPDGQSVTSEFAPAFPPQTTGISYGLAAGSGTGFRYFDTPSPWLPNPPTGFLGLVGDTEFDLDRGFFENPISVQVTCVTPGATIRYTLDMSEPTLVNGTTVTPGVPVSITTTTCLRARAFLTGWLPSNIDTQTYIFLDDVVTQPSNPPGFPSTWKSAPGDYHMDPAVTARYTTGELKDALKSLPTISIVTEMDNLFDDATGIYDNPTQEGILWERPASVEWIDPNGGPEIQLNCGLRIQGQAARTLPKKPFRLLFKTIYGPSKLDFPIFSHAPDAVDSFDSIVLRAHTQGINYGAKTLITDENGRRALLDMGTPQAHGTYVHLYVNGLYWGMYNPSERPQASFCSNYFGGSKDEWDVNNANEAIDGTYDAFDAMLAQVRGGPADDAAYRKIQGNNPDGTPNPAFPAYLDMPNYIDYMLCNIYLGTGDWAANAAQGTRNYYCGRRNSADTPGYEWFIWDAERSVQYTDVTGVSYGPAEPYAWLRNNAEFQLLFADHAQRHLFNGGALTSGVRLPAYTAIADQVRAAIICEEARWDRTSVDTFETEVADRTSNWFASRSAVVLGQLRSAGLYPGIDAPVFSPHGGSVAPGTGITITAPAGTIYYTLDGSDPRLPGGAISGSAATYSVPPVFSGPGQLKARVLNGGEWSALTSAFFSIDSEPASPANLVISEIHYHPGEPSTPGEIAISLDRDDYEFVELYNIGPKAVDLTGVLFSNGISFAFADHTLLASGARLVLVRDLAAFTARYGPPDPGLVGGEYSGRLSNDGEQLTLAKLGFGTLHELTYSDQPPWPVDADGIGYSLILLAPANNPDPAVPANWAAGSTLGGTPGAPD